MSTRREPATATSAASSVGAHFPCLDAYRAIGMVMVLANHSAFSTGYIQGASSPDASTLQQVIAPLIARFDLAVPMFFVLSGFLLYRPYARSLLEGRPRTRLSTFYRRRALRILPGYWAALGGLAVFSALSAVFDLGVNGVWAWIGNLLALPALGIPVERCIDGTCVDGYGITQAWSIGVEITFYLLLPLWAGAVARFGARFVPASPTAVLIGGCAALYLLGLAFRAVVVFGITDASLTAATLLWLPMYLDLFAIGMGLAVLSARLAEREQVPGILAWVGNHPVACWGIAGAVLVAVAQMEPPSRPFGLDGNEYLPRQFAYGIASAIWLAPSIFGDQTHGRLRRFLAHPALVYLGGISLSFYLWHLAFVEQAKAWTVPDYAARVADNPLASFSGSFPLVMAIAFVTTLAVSAIAHRTVEVPFLQRKGTPR